MIFLPVPICKEEYEDYAPNNYYELQGNLLRLTYIAPRKLLSLSSSTFTLEKLTKTIFTKENYETILEMYFKVCEYQMEKVKDMVEVFILAFLNELNSNLLLQSTILNRDDPFTMKDIKLITTKFSQF
ncbi:hypothetical protein CONCODRAFT_2548 [Conidiobolus coronatus NRRL 28638]|uniref:Uncharacterized protein n=1 Tax=Conidiobolus coronatus (strain ATCC 28846 / CBS 209.66 / NRRL 28638) TaxID=796925 RepID=A0A137PH68_CONC2|nr:hypothetical protein CONCODRAFT_2548 [Conidiobolus coronatus NRRL 28638]|eukprot:KXN74343.1 hypothetical protein CONCODRAFT_2548 [Conidiobolus coronatus NRRL 28638]